MRKTTFFPAKLILALAMTLATFSASAQSVPSMDGDESIDRLFSMLNSLGVGHSLKESNFGQYTLVREAIIFKGQIAAARGHAGTIDQREIDSLMTAAVDSIVQTIEALDWGVNPEGMCERNHEEYTIEHCYNVARQLPDGRTESVVFKFSKAKNSAKNIDQGCLVHKITGQRQTELPPFNDEALKDEIHRIMAAEGIKGDTLSWTHGKEYDPTEDNLLTNLKRTSDGLSAQCNAKAEIYSFDDCQAELSVRILEKICLATRAHISAHPDEQFQFDFAAARFNPYNLSNILHAYNGRNIPPTDRHFAIYTYWKKRRHILILNTEGTIIIPKNIFDGR